MNQHDRRQDGSSADIDNVVQKAPGKRTLVQKRAAQGTAPPAQSAPVQLERSPHAAGAAHDDPFALHLEGSQAQAVAARGVESGGGSLPFLDTIQQSFGKHDVSGVNAHTGGAAASASKALGAEAYAVGNNVAFGSSPSLHTAAHEAAHVVQQRAGVSLKGGVGEAGDPYERHADAVADAVVSGRSAESLLDATPGRGGGGQAIQRQEAAVAEAPTEAPADAPPQGEESEGDKLRKAILAGAEKRLAEKTTIVSQESIDKIRAGSDGKPGMKNFTTCIEFAGQTMGDGARAVGGSPKAAQKIAMLLPNFMVNFQKETGVKGQIDAYEKAAARWDKPIADAELKVATLDEEIAQIEAQGQTGDKATDVRNGMLLKQKTAQKRAYENQLTIFHREQDKMLAKVEKLGVDLQGFHEQTEAMIRPEPGMTNGRPKPGEYIILGAAAAQAYGVKDDSKVTLAKGSFKHIAVFQSATKAPSPSGAPDEEWEEWHTIDGGGITAKATTLFIRLADGRTQFQTPGTAWAASTTALLGWLDMNKLVSQGLE